MSGLRCDCEDMADCAHGPLMLRPPTDLRQQLAAAQASLAEARAEAERAGDMLAERVAFDTEERAALRRERDTDRAALIRYNSAANDETRMKLRLFSEQRKLVAERDVALASLAEERERAQAEAEGLRGELADEQADHAATDAMLALKSQWLHDAQVERDAAREALAAVVEVAHKHGWNGVDNSKVLAAFIDGALDGNREALSRLAGAARFIPRCQYIGCPCIATHALKRAYLPALCPQHAKDEGSKGWREVPWAIGIVDALAALPASCAECDGNKAALARLAALARAADAAPSGSNEEVMALARLVATALPASPAVPVGITDDTFRVQGESEPAVPRWTLAERDVSVPGRSLW